MTKPELLRKTYEILSKDSNKIIVDFVKNFNEDYATKSRQCLIHNVELVGDFNQVPKSERNPITDTIALLFTLDAPRQYKSQNPTSHLIQGIAVATDGDAIHDTLFGLGQDIDDTEIETLIEFRRQYLDLVYSTTVVAVANNLKRD